MIEGGMLVGNGMNSRCNCRDRWCLVHRLRVEQKKASKDHKCS
jgi:hypothetical protein